VTIGIACAVAAALGVNIAMLCKHRGAVAVPDVQITRPFRSAVSLFRSRWWAIGFAVAAAAWALHVVALAFAPLSLVETVISGSIVLLCVSRAAVVRPAREPPRVARARVDRGRTRFPRRDRP
jgi:hypothetical protein